MDKKTPFFERLASLLAAQNRSFRPECTGAIFKLEAIFKFGITLRNFKSEKSIKTYQLLEI